MELQKPNKEIPFNSISSYSPPQDEKSPTLDPSHKLNNNNNNNSHSQDPSPSPTLSPGPGPSPRKEMIRYRECQRNHAAHLGSHVMDGCGEFMPAGEEGTLLALKCAACDCHRNFHRREVEGEMTMTAAPATATATAIATATANTNSAVAPIMPLSTPPNNMTTTTNCYISFSKYRKNNLLPIRPSNNETQFPMMNTTPTPTGAIHNHHHGRRAPVMMAFGGGGGAAAESSSEDLNAYRTGQFDCGGQYIEQYGVSKKRYRTKFSQEQKDKMMAFAEKIGWRMQKQDDVEVQRFCHDVGVKRQVFKVWMHNNKQALKKKQA